ncbi:MAG: cysteine desulfurase family protein [Pseudomonadota bacterium]
MTGLDGQRVYLDWNATAPLRPEARQAMLEAMDAVGNPSSVHAEGREAKKIVETARAQVARLVGCEPSEVVFTSGATEAAGWLASVFGAYIATPMEHDCILQNAKEVDGWDITQSGRSRLTAMDIDRFQIVAQASANGETGVLQDSDDLHEFQNEPQLRSTVILRDAVQSIGKTAYFVDGEYALASAHKIGGPKGVGAVAMREPLETRALLKGGGQEQGRRAGTENVIGIAGFGAAAEAAQRDLEDGVWDRVEKLRNILEERLESAAPDLIIFGKEAPRLPNTSCFAVPGWKGETQVMQMDLAGFAISAGSACSSGKVNKASRVLLAMGFDEETASSAIRVSMGPTTTEAEVMAFADAWTEHYRRRKARAA